MRLLPWLALLPVLLACSGLRPLPVIHFWELPDEIRGSRLCTDEATDHPSAIVTLFRASRSKRVDDYAGCSDGPKALREFQGRIERVAGSEQWVRPPRIR